MPADYQSTAKALSLPISPMPSPSPEQQTTRPPWTRRHTSSSRRQTASPFSQTPQRSYKEYRTQVLRSADKVQRRVVSMFQKLTLLQRILAIAALLISIVIGILFIVWNAKIFGALTPVAARWRNIPGGWLILWAITFCTAFPPIIGYSTCVTIGGFVYGFPNGWFIIASATVAGSTCSFIACRTILSKYVHRLVGGDKRFEALALTLKHDGLKILCMIRLCPLPYSLSNGAMSTMPTVHPLSFALATAIASPKLLIHIFIGSRLALLAENGGHMDAGTKAVNYASIIFGAVLGAAVGWIIYQRTVKRAKELEIADLQAGRAEVGGLSRERSYSDVDIADEELGEEDAAALAMGEDDISLWDNEQSPGPGAGDAYRDDFTDEEEADVFAAGDRDRDEEAGIGGPPGKRKQNKTAGF